MPSFHEVPLQLSTRPKSLPAPEPGDEFIMGEPVNGFTGDYAPANWTFDADGGDGSVNTGGAPASIVLTGSDNGGGANNTTYCIEVTGTGPGSLSFDWDYQTFDNDGPRWDPFGYSLNGDIIQLTNDGGSNTQSGSVNIPVQGGVIFCFVASSLDQQFGRASTTLSSFRYEPAQTFYSYQSGSWDSANNWTLDPSGTTLVGQAIPGEGDRVVILNGRTITRNTNGIDVNSVTIQSGGVLNVNNTTGHNFGDVSGQGIFRLNTATYPAGNFSDFHSSEGGTVEFFSITANLPAGQPEFNNLRLVNTAATEHTITLASNLTLNGSLVLSRTGAGPLTFRHGNSTTARNLSIAEGVTIGDGTSWTVFSGNQQSHSVTVNGDFTNNGTVRFTNQGSPNYTSGTTSGAVNLTMAGDRDSQMQLNGTTDLYRLIMDKGIDQTYILSLDAADPSFFRLFGPNNGAESGNPPNIEDVRALSLLTGTIRLGANIVIPSLVNGSNNAFRIDEDVALWLDGAQVTASHAPSGNSPAAIVPYGTLRISGNSLLEDNSNQGLVTREKAVVIIEGGTINTVCLRTSFFEGDQRGAFTMTGGTLNIDGTLPSGLSGMQVYAPFFLPYPDNSFTMSGGQINIANSSPLTGGSGTHFSLVIGADADNINVTGGEINITVPTTRPAYINSTAPFWNLNIISTTSTHSAQPRLYPATTPTFETVDFDIPANDIVVLNNLELRNNAVLTSGADVKDVKIGRNFILNAGTTYTPATNTTFFNGPGTQEFRLNGSITSGLYRFEISKLAGTLTLTGTTGTLLVRERMNLISGTINDNGKTIEVRDNLTLSGTHTGNGHLLLTTASSRTIDGNNNGIIGNIHIGGPASNVAVTLNTNLRINGELHFLESGSNNRIFNIAGRALTLGPDATIAGASGPASPLRMIRTNGMQSDGGVTKIFNTPSFTYPVGALLPPGSGGTETYSEASITFDPPPDEYGSITVRPIAMEHPNVTASGRSLTWYWRVSSSGFDLGASEVIHEFSYPQSSVVEDLSDVTEDGYVPARYNRQTSQWQTGLASSVDEDNNIITFESDDGFGNQIDGEYTAGDDDPESPFASVTIYYSANSGNWEDLNTWSLTSHTAADPPTELPKNNSVVRIGNNNTVSVTEDGALSGSLVLESGSILDLGTTTGHNFGSLIDQKVTGSGKLRISSNSGTASFPAGDFSEFLGDEGGTVEYYHSGVNFTLPVESESPTGTSLENYFNLIVNVPTGNWIRFADLDLTIYNDLVIRGSGAGRAVLLASNANGDLTIHRDLLVESGDFRVRHNGTNAREIIVQRDLRIDEGAIMQSHDATTDVIHTLRLRGSLFNEGTFTGRVSATRYFDLIFEGDNDAFITGENSSASTSIETLTVNKGSGQGRTLTLDVAGSTTFGSTNSWLTLTNGIFRLARASTITLTDTAIPYNIPQASGLSVAHSDAVINIGQANSDNADLLLGGRLEILDGTINIGNTGAFSHDIEYAAAGSPVIVIEDGELNVNGQIRRVLTNALGSLTWQQSGGAVTIRGQNSASTNAKLEILNPGSSFIMSGGTLTILRDGAASVADLYLRPGSSDVTGGTILFAPGTIGTQNFTLDANIALWDVVIDGTNTTNRSNVELRVNPLTVRNNLRVESHGSLSAGNLNITVGGSFFKDGTDTDFSRGVQTVTFNGTDSRLDGDFSFQSFHNLTVAVNRKLTLEADSPVLVENNLRINSGATLDDGDNAVEVRRSITNSGTHLSSANSESFGVFLNGVLRQIISGNGNGVFGNLIIDNSANIQLNSHIRIENRLALVNGLMDITDRRLTLGPQSEVTAGTDGGGTFDENRMLRAFGVLSDGGVRKEYEGTGDGVDSFTFPIGVFGKYTPATIDVTQSEIPGVVTIKPINAKHPSTRDPDDLQLNYYWNVTCDGFVNNPENTSGFNVNHTYHYIQDDVTGTVANYVTGRYVFPDWDPENGIPGTVNTADNQITLTGKNYICGDYTAGEPAEFIGVDTYYSRNGLTYPVDWTDPVSWSTDGHAGAVAGTIPVGAPVIINNGHTVRADTGNLLAESIILKNENGDNPAILDLEDTFGHSFGTVSGGGTIRIRATIDNQFVFPGGNYENFAAPGSGSTVEFYDDINGTLPTQTLYNNIVMRDDSDRNQTNVSWTVNGDLIIEAGSYDNTEFNRDLTLRGSWINNASETAYDPGNSTLILIGESSDPDQVLGGDFPTTFTFIQLNGDGKKELDNTITIEKGIVFTKGRLHLNDEKMVWGPDITVDGTPSASSMIVIDGDGVLRRELDDTGIFLFPAGTIDAGNGSARYSPATLDLTSGTFSNAWIDFSVVNAFDPQCGGVGNYINRYWEIEFDGSTYTGIGGTASFTYLDDDIVGDETKLRTLYRDLNATECEIGPFAIPASNILNLELTSTLTHFIVTGGDAGSILFEIAFNGNKGWRMLAFPLQDQSYASIFDTEQNSGLITQGFDGSTHDDKAPNLLWYLENFEGTPNDRWRMPGNLSENATPGRGYLYYVFGRIDEDPDYSALPEVDEIAISLQTFEQNASSVDFEVTYTAAADSGWNLIGNPFANDLNWDATTGWTRSDNISGSIYIWDPLINFDEERLVHNGDYLEWNRLSETGSLDNGLIASGQAFWVKVDNSGPIELEVTRDAVVIPSADFYGKIVDDDRVVSGHSAGSGSAGSGSASGSGYTSGSNYTKGSGYASGSNHTSGSGYVSQGSGSATGSGGQHDLDRHTSGEQIRDSNTGENLDGGANATAGQQAGTGHTTGGLSGRLGKPGAADLQAASTEIILSEPTLELVLTRDHFSRSAFIAFREGATRGIDAMDAWYLQPLTDSYITLASMVNGHKMAINTLPRRFNAPMEIPLHVGGFRDGVSMEGGFELSLAQFRDIPDSWAIELVEKKTGERVFWKQAGEPVLETRSDGRISLQRRFYTDSHEAHWTLPGVRQADDLSQGGGGLSGHRTAGGSTHSQSAGTRTGAGTTGGTTTNASSSPKGTSQGTTPHGSGSRPHGSRPASSRIPETTARHDFEFALEEPITIEAPRPGEPIRMKAMTGTTESRFVLRIYPNGEFPELPEQPTLGQNYPNPFNPVTTIPFSLPMEERVHIEVFDILGRRVQTLTNDTWAAGSHTVTFDGTRLASGVYIIRMRAGSATETSKMTLIK